MPEKLKLPAIYRKARWRNTTVKMGREIGVGFDDVETGKPIMLRLDLKSARNLAETLAKYLNA
jgi:hypothetical protein